ncbi:MBOAT family protein [Mucilaginibacter sp. BJC16-A38]|uniref:MBOAT family O-acyltransferase n=1 Tax=Mucilaginibacter phenanthrenivorans TaxID=1234842 RepID=UPI002157145A|nr:MBOAT family O-acyltransferase [Mucilaginibacter phenanthrenivorans]MCR8561340.1 MBOAT family protein [Mucilaginibacter phenanthrenivorans]
MLFNSVQFIIFFIAVVTAFYLTPFKWRWLLLLAASCYFYMAYIPVYILILAFTITIDYFVGIYLERTTGRAKKLLLVISILSNIGILGFYKYYNFVAGNISVLLNHVGYHGSIPLSHFILPIGLSFHTFQALSYIIEVYRGTQKAERHFGIYALYVMFFPQMVAGPIERPQNIIYQFYEKQTLNVDNISSGLKLMLRGFFKKLVVADRIAIYVNAVYKAPLHHDGKTVLVATFLFAFQIYCDFSGYSDIALGAARVLGFKLLTNFNQPYLARNVSEFWKRWHISLTTWFRDYLYIPMGGNRVTLPMAYFNLLVVFVISGLWHGASWNFVIWGALNGFYLIFLRLTRKFWPVFFRVTYLDKIPVLKIMLQVMVTTLFITISWVFFRANNFTESVIVLKKIFSFSGTVWRGEYTLFYCIIGILILLAYEVKTEYFNKRFTVFNSSNSFIRNFSYGLLVIAIIMLGVFDGGQFIYFQF